MGNTNSSITFKDLKAVDYTFDNVDDDGLINLQTFKRHRCLREVGLPYRKANSRRVVERSKRRESRPYLSLSGGKLAEAKTAFNVNELDSEFLTRAEDNPSLNLTGSDFTSLRFKKEIQYLIKKHFFPEFDLSNTLESSTISKEDINTLVKILKSQSAQNFERLFNFRPQGIGPGEALLYFIYDKVILGGGSKAGDVTIGKKEYEVKSVLQRQSGELYDFRLGSTVPLVDVIEKLLSMSNSDKDVNSSQIAELKKSMPKEMKKIEDQFAKLAYDFYFSKHDIIFFNNAGKNQGDVIAVKSVKAADIRIDRVTAGTIKPIIKI
jgi:hypothetical protein